MSDDMGLANRFLAGGLSSRPSSAKSRSGGAKKPVGGLSMAKCRRRAVQSAVLSPTRGLAAGVHTVLGGSVVAAWVSAPETEFVPRLQQLQASLRELANPTAQGLLVLPRGTELWRYTQQIEEARQVGIYVRRSPLVNTARGAAQILKALHSAGNASTAQLKAFAAQLQAKR